MPVPSFFWKKHYKDVPNCCMTGPMEYNVGDTGKRLKEFIDTEKMRSQGMKWIGWEDGPDYRLMWLTPNGLLHPFKSLPRSAAGKEYERKVGKLGCSWDGQPKVSRYRKPGSMEMETFYEAELRALKNCEFCPDLSGAHVDDDDESGTAGSDRTTGIPVGDPANTDYSKMGQGYGTGYDGYTDYGGMGTGYAPPAGGYINETKGILDTAPVLGGFGKSSGNWNEGYGYDTRTDGGGDGSGEKIKPLNLTRPETGIRRVPIDPVPDIKTPLVWVVPRDIIDKGPVTGGKKPVPGRTGVPMRGTGIGHGNNLIPDRRGYFIRGDDDGYYDFIEPDPDPGGGGGGNSNFPLFATLLRNYPLPYNIRPDRTPIDRNKPVNDNDGNNFLYFNQCAIRLSIALKKSGVNLSGAKNYTNPKGNPYGNGNILGATNLARFLQDKLGEPEKYNGTKQDVQKAVQGRQGIIYFQGIEEDGSRSQANVHIELWSKDHYMSTFPFDQMFGGTNIWFWPLK